MTNKIDQSLIASRVLIQYLQESITDNDDELVKMVLTEQLAEALSINRKIEVIQKSVESHDFEKQTIRKLSDEIREDELKNNNYNAKTMIDQA